MKVFMVGPSENAPGGMSAVIASYRRAGLFDDMSVRYVSTYEGAGLFRQARIFGRAMAIFVFQLLMQRVGVLHVHSASRGSFWRKSILCGLARLFGTPYIFHLHSGEFPSFYRNSCGPLAQKWVKRTLERASAVFVLTQSWRQPIEGIAPSAHIHIVLNPVCLSEAFVKSPSSGLKLLFMGRIRQKKGAFDLLHAMDQVAREVPDVELKMAGDGELDQGKAVCSQIGLTTKNIEFLGWVDGEEKKNLLADADIFVLPSYYEGLPIGILEAMAAGVVVVASKVGGIPDIIRHMENGILLQPGDVENLAFELVRLLKDPALRSRLAEQARSDVKGFDSRLIVSDLREMYKILASRLGGSNG